MTVVSGPSRAAQIPAAGVTWCLKNMAPNRGKSAVQPRKPMDRKEKPRINPPALLFERVQGN